MTMFDEEPAIAWTAMPYRAKVFGADGTEIGTAESLLGDEEEDIFHGIAVKTGGRLVEIAAAHVDSAGAAALESYREEKWFHIGWGGLFRKHPQWDSSSRS
jgi:hypothetical protein